MRATLPVALPLGLAAGLALSAALRPAQAEPPAPARVAVVDVFEVMNNAPAKSRVETEFKEARKRVADFARDERTKLENEASDIELLPRTDPKRRDRERALARLKVTSEFDVKARMADAEKTYFDALEGLWREVRAEVRRVAQERGFTVVLSKTEDDLNVRSHDEFVLNVAMRSVLYYDGAVDVTKAVLERMAARGPGGPPPVPAGGGTGPGRPPIPPAVPPAVPPAMDGR
jgi:Skp family chaperone for outer membrane proteins